MQLEQRLIQDRGEWNRLILECSGYSPYSTFEWGEYKRRGWAVRRLAFFRDGDPRGAIQLLSKRAFGVTVGWAPGGVAHVEPDGIPPILEALRPQFDPGSFVCRLCLNVDRVGTDTPDLRSVRGLAPARKSTRLAHKLVIDLEDERDILERMTRHHRRAFRRSLAHELSFRETAVIPAEFAAVSRSMSELKDKPRIGIPVEDLERAARAFGKHMTMFSVVHENNPVAACLVMRFDQHAFYYLAASNPLGRKVRASYFMVTRMLETLRNDGVRFVDLGGILPHSDGDVDGVTYFKMGFPGTPVRLFGDYDLASNGLLRILLNSVVGRRFPR